MGIKYFFAWIQKNFDKNIYPLKRGETIMNNMACGKLKLDMVIDNLMLDMNGIFHNSAQKIFEYGSFKKADSILLEEKIEKMSINERIEKQNLIYEDICCTIDKLLKIITPTKRLILCIDGPAPLAKQNQQRQRRFRAAKESSAEDFLKFDSNSISPGTKFMDFLGKYIDWYIRKKISTDEIWKKLEVIFSSEKVPGEGEHKLLNYYRYYGIKSETFCIYANDADLIMLTLGTHNDKFYVLRDCMYDANYDYYILNTPEIAKDIIQSMRFEREDFDEETLINDFIFISFMVGNDFLPNIPSLEIMQRGIEIMFDVYKKVGESYGHLTQKIKSKGIVFKPKVLEVFLGTIGQYEKGILEGKYRKKDMFFEDKYLDKNIKLINGKYELNLENYKKDYNNYKLEGADLSEVTQRYLEGMQWVLSYYTQGTPAWRWFYPHNYAPFASDMAEFCKNYTGAKYSLDKPILPFLQLLTILPPRSAHLLPKPLNSLLYSKSSPMVKFCPRDFPIDLSGKKREWEGLVILPTLEYEEVIKAYEEKIQEVNSKDLKRNITGKSYIYTYTCNSKYYFSPCGDIPSCYVSVRVIDL
jgi:5'-3' exoribonuclease 1